jgi:hypothetical protein
MRSGTRCRRSVATGSTGRRMRHRGSFILLITASPGMQRESSIARITRIDPSASGINITSQSAIRADWANYCVPRTIQRAADGRHCPEACPAAVRQTRRAARSAIAPLRFANAHLGGADSIQCKRSGNDSDMTNALRRVHMAGGFISPAATHTARKSHPRPRCRPRAHG